MVGAPLKLAAAELPELSPGPLENPIAPMPLTGVLGEKTSNDSDEKFALRNDKSGTLGMSSFSSSSSGDGELYTGVPKDCCGDLDGCGMLKRSMLVVWSRCCVLERYIAFL